MSFSIACPRALVRERVVAFFRQTQEIAAREQQVMCLDHRFVDGFRQRLPAGVLLHGGLHGTDEAALAGVCLDDTLGLELRVGLGDGVAVDAQLFGERPDRRQALAGAHRTGGRRGLYLVSELQVNRFARLEVDRESHSATVWPVYRPTVM